MDVSSVSFVTDLLNLFTSKATDGIAILAPEAMSLMMLLAAIELAAISIISFDAVRWRSYLSLIIKFGIFAYLITNWKELAIDQIFESFKSAGLVASGSSINSFSPSEIINTGIFLTAGVLKSIAQISGWSAVMGSIGEILLKLILCLVIIGSFGFMAVQSFLTIVEFYIVTALSTILLPFSMNRYTNFLAEKVIGAVFSFGIKMMVLSFIFGISIPLIQTWASVNGEDIAGLITAAIGSLTLTFLVVQIPALAQGFLSGSPSLTTGSAISFGRSAMSMAATGGASFAGSMAASSIVGARLQREVGMMTAAVSGAMSGGTGIQGAAGNYAKTVLARGSNSMSNAASRTNTLFDTYRNSKAEGSGYL